MARPGSSRALSTEAVFTVNEAIDAMGFGWFQLKISFLTGVIWMTDAMEIMLIAVLSPAVRCHYNLSHIEVALIATATFIGVFVGAIPYGWLMDRYGRQRGLVCSAVGAGVFGIAIGFAPSYGWLLFFFFMSGCNIAAVPQAVTYYAEFLPAQSRGISIVCIEVFYTVGMMLETVIAMVVMPHLGWRYVPLFSSVPILATVPLFAFFPRSPFFLVSIGDFDGARKTLEVVAKGNNATLPPGRLVRITSKASIQSLNSGTTSVAIKDTDCEDSPLLESTSVDNHANYTLRPAADTPKKGVFGLLFQPWSMGLTTALLWQLWAVLSFVYFGVVLLTTEVLQGNLVINGTCVEKLHAAEKVCQLSHSAYVETIWTTTAEVPGLVVTVILLRVLGRRGTISVELFGVAFFYGLLVFVCDVPKVMMLFFIFGARMLVTGAFQAAYVYTPEVYPTHFRALGLSLCNAVGRVGAIATPFVAQVILAESLFSGKLIYFLVSGVSAILTLFFPYETSGRAMVVFVRFSGNVFGGSSQ